VEGLHGEGKHGLRAVSKGGDEAPLVVFREVPLEVEVEP